MRFLDKPKVRTALVSGGVSVNENISALTKGVSVCSNQLVGCFSALSLLIAIFIFQVDIVVGTPGRLESLISSGHLILKACRFFVLDEADGLLKQGYTDLINNLHRQIPKVTADGNRLQMIVCSATLHDFDVKKMAVRINSSLRI